MPRAATKRESTQRRRAGGGPWPRVIGVVLGVVLGAAGGAWEAQAWKGGATKRGEVEGKKAPRRYDAPRSGDVYSTPLQSGSVDLKALLKKAKKARYPKADVVCVLDDTKVQVEPTGLSHRVRRRIYKLLEREGAAKLTVLRFGYDPNTGYVKIRKVRRHRSDGKVEALPLKVVDLPQPARSIFWGARMKLVSVPPLEPGEALEIEHYSKGFRIAYLAQGKGGGAGVRGGNKGGRSGGVRTDEGGDGRYIPPLRGHFDDVVLFGQSRYPTLFQRYSVRLPKNKPLQFGVFNSGRVEGVVVSEVKSLLYRWSAKDLPAFKREPRSPNPWDYLPKLVLTTVPSWKVKSRWFYKVNKDQFEADEAVRKKVAQLTKGLTTQRQKVVALTRWVAANIRYRGMSMGREEGYTLHRGAQIFRERAGVCKDIAGMLITMLRAAGYTVYPAMTMAGARVEKIPADQFNHCVVALKRKDGRYWLLDPTWVPLNRELWSNAEREQHYLVGSPRGETLMKTPPLEAKHNWTRVQTRSELRRDGSVVGKVTLSGGGYPESRLRRLLVRSHGARETREVFEGLAAGLAGSQEGLGVKLEGYGFGDVGDLDTPFKMGFRFTMPSPTPAKAGEGKRVDGEQAFWLRIPTSAYPMAKTGAGRLFRTVQAKARRAPVMMCSPRPSGAKR